MSETEILIDECVDIALKHIRQTLGTGRTFDLSRIRSAIDEQLHVSLTEEHDQEVIAALERRCDVRPRTINRGVWDFGESQPPVSKAIRPRNR